MPNKNTNFCILAALQRITSYSSQHGDEGELFVAIALQSKVAIKQ